MNAYLQNSVPDYPWQATLPTIFRYFKDEFELVNATTYRPVQKELTTEAIFMLFLIMSFVILTLIRSAISVYECCTGIGTQTKSSITERKGMTNGAENSKEKKSLHTSSNTVFLANLRRFLDCFCIKSNASKLFSTVSAEEQLCALNGIRAIAVIWVVIGHTSLFYLTALRTREEFLSVLRFQGTQILENTVFIIDVFLVLSGFLNGYFFSQLYDKRKGKIPWLLFYVHRLVRVIPMYFMVLGFYSALFPYVGSGPVWPTYDTNPACKDNWIWHAVFLNNFISHKKLCILPTWYLACELQLYIISPIFLMLLIRKPKIGYIFVIIGVCASCFINFHFTKQYELTDGLARLGEHYASDFNNFMARGWNYYDILYSKPYARLGTYLIGTTLGFYKYQRKNSTNKKRNLVQLSLGWIMAAVFFWISIFGLYGREESMMETAVYNGVKHVIFPFTIGWLIFVCVSGQGGFVNRFLSNRLFLWITRFSYTIYLINIMILERFFLSLDDLIDHTLPKMILYHFVGFGILAISAVVSLVFEAPILRIVSLFFRQAKKETKADKEE